jgi:hypothetical protein
MSRTATIFAAALPDPAGTRVLAYEGYKFTPAIPLHLFLNNYFYFDSSSANP